MLGKAQEQYMASRLVQKQKEPKKESLDYGEANDRKTGYARTAFARSLELSCRPEL